MPVPDVWGCSSPLFGDGVPRGSNYFIKKFLWKNYLKKYFLYMLDIMCVECEDLQVNIKLLVNQKRITDNYYNIKSFLISKGCNDVNDEDDFFRILHLKICNIYDGQTLQQIKLYFNDQHINKRLNDYSIQFLSYASACLECKQLPNYQKRIDTERLIKDCTGEEIDLLDFFYRCYTHIFIKQLGIIKGQNMAKVLYEFIYD